MSGEIPPKKRYIWRYNYRYANKRKTLALGVYPDTSLAGARKALAKGIDPSEAKRSERITRHLASADSFEAVATECYEAKLQGKSDSYRDRTRTLLKNDLYPSLGTRPISQITSAELLMVLRKVEARGAVDMAHRAKQMAGQVCRYAVATGRAERDPRAYNRTVHLEGRREMMQGWADYLDNLEVQAEAGNVVTANFGKGAN
jgi:hypothetical protein